MNRRVTVISPRLVLPVLLLVAAVCTTPSHADHFSLPRVQACIKNRLADPSAGGAFISGETLISGMQMMPLAYRGRGYMPFWIDARDGLHRASHLIEVIGNAGRDGLLPAHYHWAAICHLLAGITGEQTSANGIVPDQWAELDLTLTDAFLLLATHLMIGKVNPETLNSRWTVDPGRAAFLPLLIEAAASGDAAAALNGLRPSHRGYADLCRALLRLHKTAESGGWPLLDARHTLRPGERDEQVRALRHRLLAGGDLMPSGQMGDPRFFDVALTAAVRQFQRRHGLDDDGIVGRETIGMLNVPVERRIRQVQVNLERWRWLPRPLGMRYVMVNTAAFTLTGVDAGQAVLQMRVVVGRPARQSPVFSSRIAYLVTNPAWTVPRTIAVADMLPAVQADPGYLAEKGIRVYATWQPEAVAVDPASVDWHIYHRDRFPFTFRQDPGPHNALGRIKFMFPNEFAVYLHGTPDHAIFSQAQRDLSSGCVRLEDPLALADFVLAPDARWTRQRLAEKVESGQTSRIQLEHPVPVHLLYMTAWVDEGGLLQFRKDIYLQDAALEMALNQSRPSPVPAKE